MGIYTPPYSYRRRRLDTKRFVIITDASAVVASATEMLTICGTPSPALRGCTRWPYSILAKRAFFPVAISAASHLSAHQSDALHSAGSMGDAAMGDEDDPSPTSVLIQLICNKNMQNCDKNMHQTTFSACNLHFFLGRGSQAQFSDPVPMPVPLRRLRRLR